MEDPESSSSEEDEVLSTSDSDGEATSPSLSEGEEGGSDQDDVEEAQRLRFAIEARVQELIDDDSCKQKCLAGKAAEVEQLVGTIDSMSSVEKRMSITTALAVSMKAGVPARQRGTGERERFRYFVPFVGAVCRGAFCACYDVSTPTVARYKKQLEEGILGVKPHGLRHNLNAAVLDVAWIVGWMEEFARDHAKRLLVVYLQSLPRPIVNAEKATQIYKSIRQYVPAEFRTDLLYAAPSAAQEEKARTNKKARRERKKMDDDEED